MIYNVKAGLHGKTHRVEAPARLAASNIFSKHMEIKKEPIYVQVEDVELPESTMRFEVFEPVITVAGILYRSFGTIDTTELKIEPLQFGCDPDDYAREEDGDEDISDGGLA